MAKVRKDPTQVPLFEVGQKGEMGPPVTVRPPMNARSSLAAAIGEWQEWMARKGMSPHTIKSFRSDLNLLARYHGRSTPVSQLDTAALQEFLRYLREGREVPCSPKSYQRRVTSLKNFFKWLYDDEILPSDPAAPVLHLPVRVPMPEVLYDDEVDAMLATAEKQRHGEKPDVRPYFLFTLLLKTGMKKGEAMGIALEHLDLSDPETPTVYIRYANPRYTLKERKLALPLDFPTTYQEYVAQYEPDAALFECTPRNLEYILQGLAEAAGVRKGPDKLVGFEMLRITSAVRDRKAGAEPEQIRRKLGLSEITWRETGMRIELLAAPPL